jgi:hypothetical protein
VSSTRGPLVTEEDVRRIVREEIAKHDAEIMRQLRSQPGGSGGASWDRGGGYHIGGSFAGLPEHQQPRTPGTGA